MFERYTERARRVVFFARYEASQFGSPYIESEHLLLGLLREDKALANRFLPDHVAVDSIRKQIESVTVVREGVSTSVDKPLSYESKRILVYAAEEAEMLRHKHIGTEHIVLGILRENDCLAEQLLRERGMRLEQVRESMRASDSTQPSTTAHALRPGLIDSIEIHGARWNASYVLPLVSDLRKFHWIKAEWKARDILVHKENGSLWFYTGQPFDASVFDLQRGGWPRDRCRICRWELFETADARYGTAYTNGRDWICSECHYKFIEGYRPTPEDYT